MISQSVPVKISGLSSVEAHNRHAKYGLNKLPEAPAPTDLAIFVSQLKNPLVYILLGSGTITLVLGDYADASIIGLAVFLNTVLGFIQERNANRALEALKKLVSIHAKVLRDGEAKSLLAEEIVPGDTVLLMQGDKVPADGVLQDSNRCFVNEAMLTGESVPVEKRQTDKVFMGTVVVGGQATLVVELTGAYTQMGKIAKDVSGVTVETPLGRQLKKFSKQLSNIVFGLLVLVILVGVSTGKGILEIFKTSVALAVSAIPEGLLVGLTVILAMGMQRILKRKGLVRNLKSAETLGGVTVICVDKTGTLTEGTMRVTDIYGDEQGLLAQSILANDLDDPIVIAAKEWAEAKNPKVATLLAEHPRIDSIPFDSNSRFFACLNKFGEQESVLFINGAPEEIIGRCSIGEADKTRALMEVEKLSKNGVRVLGFAKKTVSEPKTYIQTQDTHEGFTFVGLLGFFDPIRDDVKQAFEQTRQAGIKLMVITGDFANTAQYVLLQMGIAIIDEDIILGDVVEKLSNEELAARLKSGNNVKLFARTRPDQKLKIVNVLKFNGEVVAMMGDGVNDAPALSHADIGIVVGEATDVAKESSDLVLLDSRFSTIIAAIEEGRGIFNNLRKVILYLMCDAYEEIILVLVTLILRLPLPVTAVQVLWVNILSDGFPHLALANDPKAPGLMKMPPRSPKEPLIDRWMVKLVALVSIIGGVFALLTYVYVFKTTANLVLARSVVFATVGINSLVYVFSIRTLQDSFWEQSPFSNKWLVGAVVLGVSLQIAPFFISSLRGFFKLTPLGVYWLFPVVGSILMFLTIEILKEVFGKHLEDDTI